MGLPERPTLLREVVSLLQFRKSAKMKDRWDDRDDGYAAYTLQQLLIHEPAFAARFDPGDLTPQRLGRGWHNMAYRVGDTVIKIPHSEGPVPGFSYPPNEKGAELARSHISMLRETAAMYHLPSLVREDETAYFVKGNESLDIPDAVVSVQKYFEPFVGARDFQKLHPTGEDKQRLVDEFRDFVYFFWHLRDHKGLRIDNFGFSNLAVTKGDDDKLHFVLGDTQPADHQMAGDITEWGLDRMIAKEIVMWSWALGIGNTLRRLVG